MAETMEMPVLLPAEEGNQTQGVALDRAICLVGARARVHLPLPSPQVSKSHALIVNDQDRVYIRDLASKNHTFVNDRPIKEAALDQSDEIRIGRYKFRCGPGFTKSPPPVIYETPRAQLQIDGSEKVDLAGKTALIGARSGCDVRLKSDEVAPVHAVIFERNGKRFIRDLNSGIGTGVNGVSIHEEQLKDGDELSIGGVTIRYNVLDQAEDQSKLEIADSLAQEPKPLEMDLDDDSDLPIPLVGEEKLVEGVKKSEPAADAIALKEEALDEHDHLPVVGESFDSSSSLSIKSEDSKAVKSAPERGASEIDSLIPLAEESPSPKPPAEKPTASLPVAEAKEEEVDRLTVERESSPELDDLAEFAAPSTRHVEAADLPAPLAEPEPQRKIEINMSEADIEDEIAEPEEKKAPEDAASGAAPENPGPQRITHLVGEIAEKAEELKSAWKDYSQGHDTEGEHPGATSEELQWPSKADLEDHEPGRSSDPQIRKEKSMD
ncbi:MAG TPA: FHA domain-containing protein [Tepidisphaeraceae bacterium]|nr:FHA domain-containing protein [Tepidisphaeraceae bacterium]